MTRWGETPNVMIRQWVKKLSFFRSSGWSHQRVAEVWRKDRRYNLYFWV